VKKYAQIAPANARPTLLFDRPELQYPERLNAVETVLEGALEAGWGERTAFYCGDSTLSFADVHREVHRMASGLRSLGLQPGDAVILRMPDGFELVAAILAVQALGAVAIPTYVQLRADDLRYRANDADARLLLVSAELLDEAAPLRDDISIVACPSDQSGRFKDLNSFLPDGEVTAEYADTDADELSLLLYTSGSTGAPKGTCHCHRDMLAIADSYWRNCIAPAPDDVVGGPPSIAFAMGFGLYLYFPLRLGHAAVLEPDKSPQKALELIAKHRITIFVGVVSYYNMLARLIEQTDADISSLRHILTGGEPLSEEAERAWLATTGKPLEQFIGTTEMLHIFATVSRPGAEVASNSLGTAVPGYTIVVVDPETLRPVADGEPGLLCVQGPTGTVYWNKPSQQDATAVDGWNVFQDLVRRDEKGNLSYIARFDEVIVSSGYNISPVQVENVLLQHSAVLECACVPAPDPTGKRSAIVKAYVVVAPEQRPNDTLSVELQEFVKNNAPPYLYPRAIEFISALPKTINGKTLRSELRVRAAKSGAT
jgi:2-aminobenzoate-CoA ligase